VASLNRGPDGGRPKSGKLDSELRRAAVAERASGTVTVELLHRDRESEVVCLVRHITVVRL